MIEFANTFAAVFLPCGRNIHIGQPTCYFDKLILCNLFRFLTRNAWRNSKLTFKENLISLGNWHSEIETKI